MVTQAAGAQASLASRVSQIRDGVARVQYEPRPGVCGDGRDAVGFRQALFARNFESYGSWSNVRCVAGPVRVALTVVGGQVTQVQTQVGGEWRAADGRVTDLGTISPQEASAFFFSLVPALERESGTDRLLLPAVLANDALPIAPLLRLAGDGARTDRTRRAAVQWLGLVGDASVIPALVGFAKNNDSGVKKGIASAAIAALAYVDDGAGVPALIDLSRDASASTRKSVAFWLGQAGDPRASRRLHQMIEDTREETRVRADAIFALSHGDKTGSAEFEYLRRIYSQLDSDQLKESVHQGMGEDDVAGGTWLIERARDRNESTRLRKNALFWAGQRAATRTADIVSVYRDADDSALREHVIFVLSQRQDDAATDALFSIVRDGSDKSMRSKALFWLAQKKDPRVTKLISDILAR